MRETASGIVAILILAVALIWVSVLAGYSLAEHTTYLREDGEPRLFFIWRSLLWFASEGDLTGRIFAGLVALAGVCIQALAKLHRSVLSVVLIAAACLVGIIACVTVMVVTGEADGPVVRSLRAAVGGDEAQLRGAIQLFMGALAVWFVGFLAAQLGISILKENGAVRALFRKG
jgi:hypothetical protein